MSMILDNCYVDWFLMILLHVGLEIKKDEGR